MSKATPTTSSSDLPQGHRTAAWQAGRLVLLALVLAGLLTWWLPLDRWLDRRHDLQLAALAPAAAGDAALVVDVDEATVQRLGPWPLRRDAYVPTASWLLDKGARAVVFTVLLVDAREGDAEFGQWLVQAQARAPVILGARSLQGDGDLRPAHAASPGCRALLWPAWQLPLWARADGPLPRLALDRVGALSVPLDADGVLRRLPLWQQAGALALPSMPFAVWRALQAPGAGQAAGSELTCVDTVAGAPALQGTPGQAWPLDEAHRVMPWLATPGTAPAPLAMWRLHEAAQGQLAPAQEAQMAGQVRGRVVFISSSAALGDQVLTPQGPRTSAAVLAATYDALALGRLLTPPRPGQSAWWLLCLLLPLAASTWARARHARPRPGLVLPALALALLGLLGADLALVAWQGQLSQIGWPVATLMLLAVAELWRWRQDNLAEQDRQRLARAELVVANQVKSDFLAHVSHEIRTPLNALLGAAEMLNLTPLDPAQQRYVSLFNSAGHELTQMLSDLLDLSKLEAGLLVLRREPFSLVNLVAQQLLLFEARAKLKGLALQVDSNPDLPETVLGDATRLTQVLRNLLSNAVKFTSVGQVRLVVGFGAQRNWLRFEIHDTGMGVPADRVASLFSAYQQADEQIGQRLGGTGLGLNISRGLVEAMGGSIGLQSREGLGSTFYFELPLPPTTALPAAADENDMLALHSSLPALSQPSSAGDPSRRLLIADDSPHNLALAEAYLEGWGLSIDRAQDGATALRRFERCAYRVVLLDLNMPVMDGLQTVRAMRAFEQRRQRAPALMVAQSGRTDPHDVAQSLAAGFDLHLAKPFSRAQLLAAVAPLVGAQGLADDTLAAALGAEAGPGLRGALSQLPDSDLPSAFLRMGDETLYDRVLQAAREPLLRFEQRLSDALDTMPCDLDQAQTLVHDLRALADTLGLPGLAIDAKRLDKLLMATVLPDEDVALRQARQALLMRMAGVHAALLSHPADLGKTGDGPARH